MTSKDRKRKRQRKVASCKSRRETLMKKAGELERLCNAKVFVVCYDCDGNFVEVRPDEEDKRLSMIMEYYNKSKRNKEVNVWDSLGSHRVKKLLQEKTKGIDEIGGVEDEEEVVMLGDLPVDSLAGLWRDLETKRRAMEEMIRLQLREGKSIQHGNYCTWSWESGLSTAPESRYEAVDNPNWMRFNEYICDLGDKAMQETTSASAACWPREMPMRLIDDGRSELGEAGANSNRETMFQGKFSISHGVGNSAPLMPLTLEKADDDHQLDFEAADNMATNLMGFDNMDAIFPPNTSLWYDLWQGTSVSPDDMGCTTPPATPNQNRQCMSTYRRHHNQPLISPLHEALPSSFWPQPLQL